MTQVNRPGASGIEASCRTIPGWAACAVLGALALPVPAMAWNWAEDDSRIAQRPEFAPSRAICRALADRSLPEVDRPAADARPALAGCDAGALYYGIGQPRQPQRARLCAVLAADTAGDDADSRPFNGLSMLMTIYANGVGARRDLDLATALACRIPGAPAEVSSRVEHLHRLAAEHWQGHDFDYCDDITSGLAAGHCAARDAAIDTTRRETRLDALAAGWPAPLRQAYSRLRDAETAYAEASADNEVDLSGTARAAFAIQHTQAIDDAFERLLKGLENGGLPESAEGYATANARLNAVYRRIMAIDTPPDERGPYASADSLPWTTVTHAGIRQTQRAWLRYREAWVDFAAVRYPDLPADVLRSVLTRERIEALATFLPAGASP